MFRPEPGIYRLATVLVVGVLVVATAVGIATVDVGVAAGQADGETLVVDADGGADYRSIQAAVDAATAGDTVEVRPGTYEEEVVVGKSITLVAPGGATLDGSSIPAEPVGVTVPAGSDAEPVIEGFEIRGYYDGVVVSDSAGAWTLRNLTIRGSANDGVAGGASTGAWTIADSTIVGNADEGVDVENTTGSWTIRNTTIADSGDDAIDADGPEATAAWTLVDSTLRGAGDDGIDVDDTSGAWTVRRTTITGVRTGIQAIRASGDFRVVDAIIRNATAYGMSTFRSSGNWTVAGSHVRFVRIGAIEAAETSGAWTVRDTTVSDASVGVHGGSSSGAWTVENATVRNTTVPTFEVSGEGTGVFAGNTTGAWEVHGSNIVDHEKHALNATRADPPGDATGNWWGRPGGPADRECVGAVDCGDALSAPADVPAPPTVGPNYFTESSGPLPGDVGLASIAIIASLAVILVVLGVLSWRIT